jgi:hypothetical protein
LQPLPVDQSGALSPYYSQLLHARHEVVRVENMAIDGSRSARASAWRQAQARRGWNSSLLVVLAMLAVAYAVTVLVFHPGYATVDARYVHAEATAQQFGDWQSPAMGMLWRLIDPVAPGSLSMFLLTITLYWLGFGLVAMIAARRSLWLSLGTLLLAFAPPAFLFVGMVWRDVLFGVTWLAAAAIVFAAADRNGRMLLPMQALALTLVGFGVLLRPNAVFAAPLLAAYAAWPFRFDWKRTAILFVPAVALFYALIPLVYYGMLDAKRQNPLHSILVFDLGGITHFTGSNQFPASWDADQTALLTSRCYDPVRWDSYWHVPPCPFVMQRLEQPSDPIFGTPRLVEAWWRAVTAHPLAYLAHRATFMWQFLARSNLVLPVWDWREPAAAYGNNPYLRPLIRLHDALQPTLLFRPGLWLALAITVCACAWRLRLLPAGAFAVGVTASAIVYLMTFFFVGVASDFRYSYWCVLATLIGAAATVLGYRGGERTRAEKPGR